MIRKTISMPDELGDYIDERVKTGGYGNDSEFIRDLLRRDKQRESGRAKFQKLIDEGLASGVSNRTIEEIFQEALKRHEQRKKRA